MRLAALRRLVHDESGKRDAPMIKRRDGQRSRVNACVPTS